MQGCQSQQSGGCLSCSTTLSDQDDDFGDDEHLDQDDDFGDDEYLDQDDDFGDHEHHNDGGDDKNLDYDGS